MAIEVLVPRLGEGVDEVTITKWLKQIGDSINELDPLLEVNTDKVDSEIPAPTSGIILSINIPEGSIARVGEVLALIGQPGETHPESDPRQTSQTAKPIERHTQPVDSPPASHQPASPKDLGFISPVVAKIASQRGINLQSITGTGLGGRITKNDVLAFVQNDKTDAPTQTTPPQAKQNGALDRNTVNGDNLIKHSLMRKSIAEHMLASKRTSPHVLTIMEVDMSRVVMHVTPTKMRLHKKALT